MIGKLTETKTKLKLEMETFSNKLKHGVDVIDEFCSNYDVLSSSRLGQWLCFAGS